MTTKRHPVEHIVAKLREVERLIKQGMSISMAAKRIGIASPPRGHAL
jgi:hypothetical protein